MTRTRRQIHRETYKGGKARSYERKRQGQFWNLEHARMVKLASRMEPGTKLLDVPVGTGRFLKLWERAGFVVTGVDLQPDMLEQAEGKGTGAVLAQGSIFDLDYPDEAFDVAVSVRLFNWLETHEVSRALVELSRVTAQYMIVGTGTYTQTPRLKSMQCIHPEAAFLEQIDTVGLMVTERHLIQHNDRGLFEFWELRG